MLIGEIRLRGRLFLAPLAGVTDRSFRRLCCECGAALSYSEMVSAKALTYRNRRTYDLLATDPSEGPVGYQIFGSEPGVFAEAAEILEPFPNVLIDVNMGCPVPKVVKNGEGSALMRDPDLAGRLVEALKKHTKKPVTAKFRAGWDAAHINCVEMAQTLEAAGADAVCLHARTREQYYSGRADWGLIARVKAAVRIPVIGNGDVFSHADAARMMEQTGCDFVMVARGALGNPWIFSGARAGEGPVSRGEKAAMFIRHARLAGADKGARIAALEMRGAAGWYFKGEPGVSQFREKANRARTIEELISLVEMFAKSEK
ncbi:MAG: tRNA dihydrouridine synthase DusB [Clostridiales Family XIII bacterium]|jgi:nifR3 family TIM-barrel protein|nr:tRNA dihydrouridine synthase DusB [Clostridiales Family XIII bacterium]